MSSVQRKTKRPMENGARRAQDYVNVGYAFEAVGARNFLASIGGTQRITPDSPVTATSRYNLSGSTDSIDGGRGRQRREKGTKNKTKRLHSTLLEETDSSSMDGLSVSSELLEARAREEEHYNKLKLNLNQLEDKRVRRGVSVLYADRVNGDIGFRKRTPSGSRMTRPVVIPASHIQQHQVPSFLTAKNEGHVNSVHSVSGKPMSRSSSILWKTTVLPKSFSTGDMCRIATEGIDGHEGDRKNKAFTRRSQSFSEIAQVSVGVEAAANKKILRRRYENVGPINNTPDIQVEAEEDQVQLRPRLDSSRSKDEHSKQRHSVLRYSTSTAEAIYSNTHATSEGYPLSDRASPSPYLSPTRSPQPQRHADMKQSRLSPLARPADMKSAPLSPLLQPANLHNDTCPITCTCHGIHFIDAIVTIPCDNNGGEYVSEAHDFKIVIPKGAIKKRLMVELQIGVTLQGPFQTPNTSVVSPIVWVGMKPDVKLKKPMEIELPHFLDLTHSTRKSEIFLRASDKVRNSNSKTRYTAKKYMFKEATDGQGIIRDSHGILLSKHCGFFCIASNNLSKQQARCCLLTVLPKPIHSNTWKMHYCVTYLLKSCIQVSQCAWVVVSGLRKKALNMQMCDQRKHIS